MAGGPWRGISDPFRYRRSEAGPNRKVIRPFAFSASTLILITFIHYTTLGGALSLVCYCEYYESNQIAFPVFSNAMQSPCFSMQYSLLCSSYYTRPCPLFLEILTIAYGILQRIAYLPFGLHLAFDLLIATLELHEANNWRNCPVRCGNKLP